MKKYIDVLLIILILVITFYSSTSYGAITASQGNDLAEYAKIFIKQGNDRKDENGFPLLTYGLTGTWSKNVEIRNNGYQEKLTTVGKSGYYFRNGKYIELGNKWMMDCGTFVTYIIKKTLGLSLYNGTEPWHVQDIYNDALKGSKSQYFEFVYSKISVGNINYSKLQKGDIIARITPNGNHGMIYVGDGYIAHANRDMIKSYGDNKVSGFQVNELNRYYLPGTVVRIMRIKDDIVSEDFVMDDTLVWPDNGETVNMLGRTKENEKMSLINLYDIAKMYNYPMFTGRLSYYLFHKVYDKISA